MLISAGRLIAHWIKTGKTNGTLKLDIYTINTFSARKFLQRENVSVLLDGVKVYKQSTVTLLLKIQGVRVLQSFLLLLSILHTNPQSVE